MNTEIPFENFPRKFHKIDCEIIFTPTADSYPYVLVREIKINRFMVHVK